MNNDVIFTTGLDNSDLKQGSSEAQQIIDQWIEDSKQKIEELEATSIGASGPIQIPIEIEDGPLKDLFDDVGNLNDEFQSVDGSVLKLVGSAGRIAGPIGVALGLIQSYKAATQENIEQMFDVAKGLEEQVRLEKERLELVKQRLSLREGQISQEIESGGDSRTIDQLRAELAGLESDRDIAGDRLREAQETVRELKALNQQAVDSAVANDPLGGRGSARLAGFEIFNPTLAALNEAKKAEEEAKENLAAKKQAIESVNEVIQEGINKEREATEKATAQRENLNRILKDQISLQREAELRASGQTAAADSESDERNFRQRQRQFAELGPDAARHAAEELQSADRRARAARAEALAKREAARAREEESRKQEQEDNRRERAQKRFADATERHNKQVQNARQRLARFDEDSGERRNRLISRQERQRERRNRPIGGIDASLQGAISRIQQAASKPDPSKQEEKEFRRQIKQFEEEKKKHRGRLEAALNTIASNPPQQQGLR